MRPHLLIIGDGDSGKTTLAKTIHQVAGLTGSASSWFMAPLVAAKLGYASAEEAWSDRRNHRMEWKQIIVDYRKNDPTRVVRELYEKYHIYEGLRDREEFDASREAGLFDLICYVDRGRWEGDRWVRETRDVSNDLTRADADIVLENSTTKQEFINKCNRFARMLQLLLMDGGSHTDS